jgi:hypothetical protein
MLLVAGHWTIIIADDSVDSNGKKSEPRQLTSQASDFRDARILLDGFAARTQAEAQASHLRMLEEYASNHSTTEAGLYVGFVAAYHRLLSQPEYDAAATKTIVQYRDNYGDHLVGTLSWILARPKRLRSVGRDLSVDGQLFERRQQAWESEQQYRQGIEYASQLAAKHPDFASAFALALTGKEAMRLTDSLQLELGGVLENQARMAVLEAASLYEPLTADKTSAFAKRKAHIRLNSMRVMFPGLMATGDQTEQARPVERSNGEQ